MRRPLLARGKQLRFRLGSGSAINLPPPGGQIAWQSAVTSTLECYAKSLSPSASLDRADGRLVIVMMAITGSSIVFRPQLEPIINADAACAAAKLNGWPDSRIHKEHFSGDIAVHADDAPFDIQLARSGKILRGPKGQSALAVLSGAGVDIPRSCEQGVCGSCLITVCKVSRSTETVT